MWITVDGIANSGGNLCLHLIGNLKICIGATLGKTVYVRDRSGEFSLKNVDRSELLVKIENLKIEIEEILKKTY